jgi:lipopolysaccharide biosynthesis glycosyltransferase
MSRSLSLPKAQLHWHAVPQHSLDGLPSLPQVSVEMWLRCLLPQLLTDCERVLYLDCDTIVLSRLQELWEVDFNGASLAAVTSPFNRGLRNWPRTLGLPHARAYFNSGVLLLNLEQLRRSGAMEQALAFGRETQLELRWPDQDALNRVLWEQRLNLHPRWNVMTSMYRASATDHAYLQVERAQAVRAPAIVHFEGAAKPWEHGQGRHPHNAAYHTMRARTLWPALPRRLRGAREHLSPSTAVQVASTLSTLDVQAQRPHRPQISVVIPTHNRKDLLVRALHSVFAQTLPPQEIIVVDDASSDGTGAAVAGLQAQSPVPLRYLCSDTAGGAAAARNRGWRAAQAEVIAFLDDDDQWLAHKLESQWSCLRDDGPGLSLSGFIQLESGRAERVGGDLEWAHVCFPNGITTRYRLVSTSGWMVDRQILVALDGFDEDFGVWEDWDLALRISQHFGLSHCAEPLYIFNRDRPPGLVENKALRTISVERAMARHKDYWTEFPQAAANHALLRWQLDDQRSWPSPALWKNILRDQNLRGLWWRRLRRRLKQNLSGSQADSRG